MFIYQHKIKMHETDAAGIIFFSRQFQFIHDAYEAFMETFGLGFKELLSNKQYFQPIVHAEADYKAPLFVGDLIEIQLTVSKISTSSFVVMYNIFDHAKKLVGTAQTVHVAIDKKTRKKISLPTEVMEKLNSTIT